MVGLKLERFWRRERLEIQRSEVVAIGRVVHSPDMCRHLTGSLALTLRHAVVGCNVDSGHLVQQRVVTNVHFLHNKSHKKHEKFYKIRSILCLKNVNVFDQ